MIDTGVFKTVHVIGERPIYIVERAEVEEVARQRAGG